MCFVGVKLLERQRQPRERQLPTLEVVESSAGFHGHRNEHVTVLCATAHAASHSESRHTIPEMLLTRPWRVVWAEVVAGVWELAVCSLHGFPPSYLC